MHTWQREKATLLAAKHGSRSVCLGGAKSGCHHWLSPAEELLLRAGVSPDSRDRNGATLLARAALYGHTELTQQLGSHLFPPVRTLWVCRQAMNDSQTSPGKRTNNTLEAALEAMAWESSRCGPHGEERCACCLFERCQSLGSNLVRAAVVFDATCRRFFSS